MDSPPRGPGPGNTIKRKASDVTLATSALAKNIQQADQPENHGFEGLHPKIPCFLAFHLKVNSAFLINLASIQICSS